MSSVFYLKYRDTVPGLRVQLLNPDGSIHDLTDSTKWALHIWLSDGSKLQRDMVIVGASPLGTLGYDWIATDWSVVSGGGTVGGLVVGPSVPLAKGAIEHRMEYEVLGPGGARMTFPNADYDTLRIITDIGQVI
jgi:hypothetical protein